MTDTWERTYRRTMIGGPASGRTRRECWAATSPDGVWHAERIESAGTPWALVHLPTGVDLGSFTTLRGVQEYVASGRAEQQLAATRP